MGLYCNVSRFIYLCIVVLCIAPQESLSDSQLVPGSGFIEEVVLRDLPPATAAAFGPGDRIYLALKDGIVRVAQSGVLLPTPFIDISAITNRRTDRGLGGLALDPQFPVRPYVYLFFTYDAPGLTADGTTPRVSQLIRVQADAANDYNVAIPDSIEVLLGKNSTAANTASQLAVGTTIIPEPASCMTGRTMDGTPIEDCLPSDELSHSAGALVFGADGYLYASHGDGAPYNSPTKVSLRSQMLDSLAGKVLRIDPNTGFGVSDNPFYEPLKPNSNRSKVWTYGLRNPFRMTVSPFNGQAYIGDVGTSAWEEANIGKGANLGWPCYEGGNMTNSTVGTGDTLSVRNTAFQNLSRTSAFCAGLYNQGLGAVVAPLFSYKHPTDASGEDLGASITGVAFYSGVTYPLQYRGALFIADYAQGLIRYLSFNAQGFPTVHAFANETSASAGPVQLITAPDTNVYALFLDLVTRSSELRRFRYTGSANTPPIVALRAYPVAGSIPLAVSFDTMGTSDADGQALSYSWDFGDGAGASETSSNPIHLYQTVGTFAVTVTVREQTAPFAESTKSVTIRTGVTPPKVYIEAPTSETTYAIGDMILFSGYAEFEGTRVPNSDLTWTILQQHNLHEHLSDTISGVASGSFPTTEHTDNTRFIICLYATAGQGLEDQGCVTINPRTTDATFLSDPTGAPMSYLDEEQEFLAPYTLHPIQNSLQTVVAADMHQGRRFTRWDDGATTRERSFVIGTIPITFRAIYENHAPTATISGSSFAGVAPLQVTLSAATSTDPDGSALLYTWNLGSGQTADTITVTKTFTAPGQYPVTLRVTDALGLYTETSKTILVLESSTTNTAPTVVPPLPQTVPLAALLSLNGTILDDGLPNGTLQTIWSRVRGPTTLTFSNPSAASTSANASTVGTYLIKLEATDSLLRSAKNTVATVNPATSTFGVTSFSLINAATDQAIPGYETITNGAVISTSSLPTGSINVRANTQGSGIGSVVFLQDAVASSTDNTSPYAIAPSSAADFPAWAYTTKRYLITAVPYSASGGTGVQGDALSIQFTLRTSGPTNTAPTPNIRFSPSGGTPPLTITFDGSSSSDPESDPLSYLWEFGDGQTSRNGVIAHTFVGTGTNSVRLTVTDPAGLYSTTTTTFTLGDEAEATSAPSATPTSTLPTTPTYTPTRTPTATPTNSLLETPTRTPTQTPTTMPTSTPTAMPTTTPTRTPTSNGNNTAPVVNPGLAQTVIFGGATTLNGVVTDDGLPSGLLNIIWSRVRGPGTLTFSQPNQAVSGVTSSVVGTYLVKLEATDTLLRSSQNCLFTVNPQITTFGISSFTLINAATDQPFVGYESLQNGAVINIAALGTAPKINVRANVSGSGVTSVRWMKDAANLTIDNTTPFAVAPSTGADYPAWNYSKQFYRITAVPYSGANATGTQGAALSIQFTLQ